MKNINIEEYELIKRQYIGDYIGYEHFVQETYYNGEQLILHCYGFIDGLYEEWFQPIVKHDIDYSVNPF